MASTAPAKFYSPNEERLNIGSHALGLALSFIGLLLLVQRAVMHGNAWHVVSFSIYGASMIALFAASTAYHMAHDPPRRARLRIVDHAAIYLLIAGTYTPFTLVTLNGVIGWVIFGITWGMALLGIVKKLFFTGRYELFSVLMYVVMGWFIVFFIKPLVESFPAPGLALLLAGGIAYTVGAVLYGFHRIRYNHAVFHLFVLAGSICHFLAIYLFVLPVN
jgi:hemolysin III